MPQSTKKAFPLRLDPALYATIERLAAQDLRSVNAELEILLREALARRGIKVPVTEPVSADNPKMSGRVLH